MVVLTVDQFNEAIREAQVNTSNAIKQLYVFAKDKRDFQKKADEYHNSLIENKTNNIYAIQSQIEKSDAGNKRDPGKK